jgi:hypothetical protein
MYEMRARLEELNALLDGRTKHEVSKESQLLHEALDLCEKLGHERAWYRFKALLERLQRAEVEKKMTTF